MDTQDKLIIYKTNVQNNYSEEINISDLEQGVILFCFSKFEYFKIKNESKKTVIKCRDQRYQLKHKIYQEKWYQEDIAPLVITNHL